VQLEDVFEVQWLLLAAGAYAAVVPGAAVRIDDDLLT